VKKILKLLDDLILHVNVHITYYSDTFKWNIRNRNWLFWQVRPPWKYRLIGIDMPEQVLEQCILASGISLINIKNYPHSVTDWYSLDRHSVNEKERTATFVYMYST